MADPVTVILGGLVISFVSGGVGAFVGGRNKVPANTCEERRTACQVLLITKIDEVNDKVDKIIKKLEGINITII